ncbi:hypothetical protein [Phycicoccus sp.]|uniref:hypothetical protein n=1 Tax=Phycicoccus sp. TaxID=1902410 RepID=UPI002CA94753|nr:hypothetical protein [Phycicoccus sp.]HMM93981.1 hypothetical protein [Phycicoccus sp.]
MTAFKIQVFCEDPSHSGRRVPVTNFVAVPRGGWHEVPASRAGRGRTSAGYHLLENTPAETGWALDPSVSNADIRDRFELVCRKCKGKPKGQRGESVAARSENLFPVLDGWRASGVSEVPLSLLAASLGRSKSRG